MKEKILTQKQKSLWAKLTGVKSASAYYLAGGTALALQLGHRESIDFDFFSYASVSTDKLVSSLKGIGQLSVLDQSNEHLNGILDGVRISYFHYSYPLIEEAHQFKGIKIADIKDIIPMKLIAVSQRGVKKDFIDLFEVMNIGWTLEAMFELLPAKFHGVSYNRAHILKGLTFFDDAEGDEMPKMFSPVSWDGVKRRIIAEATRLVI